jgi:uncharacterized protein (DUF1015 family)
LAEIRPFRGIRYNEESYADLAPVLAPPYDVISEEEYAELRQRSDRNVVRLILGDRYKTPPKQYDRVAELLEAWLVDETLVQDRARAVYLLDQAFEVNGERAVRRAAVARLRIEPFGKGRVFPHEETMPGPKADRLALMRATRRNMSQVFGLYPDDGSAAAVLEEMAQLDPAADGTGPDGVRNTVRIVYHHKLIDRFVAALQSRPVVVADGHHRYETAVAYRDEQRRRRGLLELDKPHEFVSVALVAMTDPGLVVLPTHRLVSGDGLPIGGLFERAASEYEVEDTAAEAGSILARLAELADRHAFGLVTPAGARVLVRKRGRRDAGGAVERLDTYLLHHEILGGLLGLGPDDWKKGGPVRYVQDPAECIAAVRAGSGQLAALVNPTRIDEVQAVALAGGRMPPKSTFFYPKLPSGVVINPLI